MMYIVENVLGVHVQAVLEVSRCLYTVGNLKQIFGKKSIEIDDHISDHNFTG